MPGRAMPIRVILAILLSLFCSAADAMRLLKNKELGNSEDGERLVQSGHGLGAGGELATLPTLRVAVVEKSSFCNGEEAEKMCDEAGELKPHRPKPIMTVEQLAAALTPISAAKGAYIARGPINGWLAWSNLELLSLTCVVSRNVTWSGQGVETVQQFWVSRIRMPPQVALKVRSMLCVHPLLLEAAFKLPAWMKVGWSPTSPGFVYWAHNFGPHPRLFFGESMLQQDTADRNAKAVVASIFTHKYGGTTNNDQHVGVLVEWEHHEFSTIFELAYLNGVSGSGGKANRHEDRNSPRPWLLQAMEEVPAMIQPWDAGKSELRAYDIPAKDYAEFAQFLHKYDEFSGLPWKQQRFRELHGGNALLSSRPVRISFNTRADIQRALLNYNGKSSFYNARNPLRPIQMCQTFASDFFTFLTGHRQPVYTLLAKPFYRPHMHWFLYAQSQTD